MPKGRPSKGSIEVIPPAIQKSIQALYAADIQLVLEFAGAGSLALAWLHAVPGSSRTILEATDRYSAASLEELLGAIPETFVHRQTAAAMARRAYPRAWRLGNSSPKLGVACTATIATDRRKRGRHRCCLAVRNDRSVTTLDLVLAKGRRDRAGEETLISELLVDAIAQAAGAIRPPPLKLLKGERIVRRRAAESDPVRMLGSGSARWVLIEADGRRRPDAKVKGLVYCGSFNPLHYGHEALAAEAARVTGLPVTFELAAVNAEKAPTSRGELERRLAQFWRRHRVAVTHSPLFAQKAELFPGCTFLVGYDTAARMVDRRFYGNRVAVRDRALGRILAAGCRVLVAGRLQGGQFKTLKDLSPPAWARKLFIELPEFRADVSATDLRSLERDKT